MSTIRVFRVAANENVRRLALSPNEKWLALGMERGSALLLDLDSGSLVSSFRGHEQLVEALAFSPDGTRLITASFDTELRLWETSTGRQMLLLQGHANSLNDVVFRSDGGQFATASSDGTIKLWDVTATDEAVTLGSHDSAATCVAFNARGTLLASGGTDRAVKVWEAAGGRETAGFTGHAGDVLAVGILDGVAEVASVSTDSVLRRWSLQVPGDAMSSTVLEPIRVAAFSGDGRRLATIGQSDAVRVVDVSSGAERAVLPDRMPRIRWVALNRDGRRLACSWDETPAASPTRPTTTEPADDDEPAVSRIGVWDVDGQARLVRTIDTETIWADKLTASSFALTERARKSVFPVITALATDSLGRLVAGGVRSRIPRPGPTATEITVYHLCLWDIESGRLLKRILAHRSQIRSVAFSEDARQIITGGDDRAVYVWDAETGRMLHYFQGHTNKVVAVTFDPMGRFAASASNDHTVSIWRLDRPSASAPTTATKP